MKKAMLVQSIGAKIQVEDEIKFWLSAGASTGQIANDWLRQELDELICLNQHWKQHHSLLFIL